jgi:hypothetical protein
VAHDVTTAAASFDHRASAQRISDVSCICGEITYLRWINARVPE